MHRGAEAELAAGEARHVGVVFRGAVVGEGGGDDDVGVVPDESEAEEGEVGGEGAFGEEGRGGWGGVVGVGAEVGGYVVVALEEAGGGVVGRG